MCDVHLRVVSCLQPLWIVAESLDAFAAEHHITRAHAENALHDGLERSVAEAKAAGALSGFVASLIARTVATLPPWLILETLERLRGFLP